MTVNFIRNLMDRLLPCPPSPPAEPGSPRWYLWQATLHNSGRQARSQQPLEIVQVRKYREKTAEGFPLTPPETDALLSGGLVETTVSVQCDFRGHGVRVL